MTKMGFTQITFAEIKDIANEVVNAYMEGNFEEVYREKVSSRKELAVSDITTITKLAVLYVQTKKGTLSREETVKKQKELYQEWERDIH